MTGPFHHDVRGDAEGEGIDDEGTSAGVGADEFPLGLDLVGADVALVGGDADLLIDAGELAQLLDVAVHRLVGVVRQGLVVLEGGVLVFLQNIPGNLVQLDGDAVRRLDGRDLDVVALDVTAAEVVDVRVPEAGEAAEQEDIPDRIQVGLGFGEFQVADAGDFLFSEVYDLPLRRSGGISYSPGWCCIPGRSPSSRTSGDSPASSRWWSSSGPPDPPDHNHLFLPSFSGECEASCCRAYTRRIPSRWLPSGRRT